MPLTDAQYNVARRSLYTSAELKDELKAKANLPTKPQLRAALDVGPDFLVDNWLTVVSATAVKPAIDSAIGFTTTTAEAKKIAKAGLRADLGL